MRIAVIDCALKEPAYESFNQLVDFLERPLSYHIPSQQGMGSLSRCFPECLIVFGSYSNVEDKLEWHRPLQEYLLSALKSGLPVLGLCFGHQLVADGFGAKVGPASKQFEGIREISVHASSPWGIKKGQTFSLVASHGQEIQVLPKELKLLASSEHCRNDIVTHTELPFLGLQAHPEASVRFVEQNLHKNGVFPSDEDLERAQSDGLKLIDDFVDAASMYLK